MNKRKFGQYFTKKNSWLMPQVKKFIQESRCTVAYDPFAGNGDMLACAKECGIVEIKGLDIDPKLMWSYNDSLSDIPNIDNAIIITNPPYLTNYSAKRKKIYNGFESYFDRFVDLYQLAVVNMLKAQDYVVAILPETFINSAFLDTVSLRIKSITVLVESPFEDTENPVCVVCFDDNVFAGRSIDVYVDDRYMDDLKSIKAKAPQPLNKYRVDFNKSNGKLAIRAVDMPAANKKIQFMPVDELNYDLQNIKGSSRLITVVDIDAMNLDVSLIAEQCNELLSQYRAAMFDLNLSPFKGNAKDGTRRRRLDYKTARAIIEQAIDILLKKQEGVA